ncbi:MAG: hypothetical protein VX247_04680, partial [Pseudomonadota bacterium]|nr:hypothetical protein [Pseudomonadota bacterium]
ARARYQHLKRDAKILAMSGRRLAGLLAAGFVILLVAALIDGGEEPLRPIEQAIDLPGGAK